MEKKPFLYASSPEIITIIVLMATGITGLFLGIAAF